MLEPVSEDAAHLSACCASVSYSCDKKQATVNDKEKHQLLLLLQLRASTEIQSMSCSVQVHVRCMR